MQSWEHKKQFYWCLQLLDFQLDSYRNLKNKNIPVGIPLTIKVLSHFSNIITNKMEYARQYLTLAQKVSKPSTIIWNHQCGIYVTINVYSIVHLYSKSYRAFIELKRPTSNQMEIWKKCPFTSVCHQLNVKKCKNTLISLLSS